VIIAGDMNVAHKPIDVYNAKKVSKLSGYQPEERRNLSKLFQDGWVDTFRKFYPKKCLYTYWFVAARPRGEGWRLDYFIVNKGFLENVVDVKIFTDVKGSDHCPIELYLKF